MADNLYRFVYTESGKLLDTSLCSSVSFLEDKISYKKNRFTPIVEERMLIKTNSIPDIALFVLKGRIPGKVFTMDGTVAKGVYSDELLSLIGNNKILKSIWINTDPDTMIRWWDRYRGRIH